MIVYYVHTSDIVFDIFYALSVTGKVDKQGQGLNSLIFEDHVTALDLNAGAWWFTPYSSVHWAALLPLIFYDAVFKLKSFLWFCFLYI